MAASESKTLTYMDIRNLAKKHLTDSADQSALCGLFMVAWICFVYLSERLIYRLAGLMGIKGYSPLSISYYMSSGSAAALLIVRLVVYHILYVAISYTMRRYYINLTDENPAVEKFMSKHRRRVFTPSIKCGLCLSMFKGLVCLPLIPGVYGIVHFYRLGSVGDIDTPGLVFFMLSIGFTFVYLCLLIHYFMSLSLVKYIIELNPRADFFDACDLSIKLMDGWHTRVAAFTFSLMPYILSCFLLYPMLAAVPFITECRLLLAKEIMGDYWQDKLPAMARRWEKQMKKERERK